MIEPIDRLAKRHALRDALLKLIASLSNVGSYSELQHTEIFNAKSFLEVTLGVDRDQFVFFVEVVELDGPDSLEAVAKSISCLKCESFVVVGHSEALCFALVADFDNFFG